MPKPVLGALAGIESAIQTAFKVAGPIETELIASMTPSIHAWDLTSPGYMAYRGRHFSFGTTSNLAPAAAGTVALQCVAQEGIILEEVGIIAQGTAGVIVNARLTDPSIAAPYALAQRAFWRDQYVITNDTAPVACTNALQADSVLGNPIWTYVTLANSPAPIISKEIHLPNLACLIIRWSGLTASAGYWFHGRIA